MYIILVVRQFVTVSIIYYCKPFNMYVLLVCLLLSLLYTRDSLVLTPHKP